MRKTLANSQSRGQTSPQQAEFDFLDADDLALILMDLMDSGEPPIVQDKSNPESHLRSEIPIGHRPPRVISAALICPDTPSPTALQNNPSNMAMEEPVPQPERPQSNQTTAPARGGEPESLFLFDSDEDLFPEDSVNNQPSGDFDLRLYDIEDSLPEPEDFEVSPRDEELQKVRTFGKVTKAERALDVAMVLGAHYGWDYDGISLLAEVFRKHWWNSARTAMVRQLDAGMTPDELWVALAARRIWDEHPEFHEHRGRGRFSYPQSSLTWPTALGVARHFYNRPDEEEVRGMFVRLFADWQWAHQLADHCPSFHEFVRLHFGLLPQMGDFEPGWSFVPGLDEQSTENDIGSLPPDHSLALDGCYRTRPAPMID